MNEYQARCAQGRRLPPFNGFYQNMRMATEFHNHPKLRKLSFILASVFATLFGAGSTWAQDATVKMGLDAQINESFGYATAPVVNAVFYSIRMADVRVPVVLIVLLAGALFATLYFGFVNFRHFSTSIRVVLGHFDAMEDSEEPAIDDKEHGEVSHFQALTAALSGTVGLGNISGVAIALSLGGPGATFWMIVAGLFGMSSKFVECTLGVRFRQIDETGRVYGGPMYYLRDGLGSHGGALATLGKILAVVFAICCVGGSLGGGNMYQANQAYQMLEKTFGFQGLGWLVGLVLALCVGVVIIGGMSGIAKVTDKIVPAMVAVYIFAALVVLLINFTKIPAAFSLILSGAFNADAITGGFVGVIVQGFKRAAFSNEAGIGSASIAHSAVRTRYAASEGLVALLEPFIDTVVICTMTALVIVISNFDGSVMTYGVQSPDGVAATSAAFEASVWFFPYILTLAVVLFAFSTMISWSYYGQQAWTFLFGRGAAINYAYKALFCICVVIGASSKLEAVINFSDAMIFAMMFPNMIGLIILSPVVRRELQDYLAVINNTESMQP